MASATALKVMRGQIQILDFKHQLIVHSLPYMIFLHFEYYSEKIFENIEFFLSTDISCDDIWSFQNQWGYLIEILFPFTMWFLKGAKQWLCVNFEIDFQMYLRLWLKPCLLEPNEIHMKFGLDIKVNWVFDKLCNHTNHLSKKGLYMVWETLFFVLFCF